VNQYNLLGCPRSTFYYKPVVNAEDAQVIEAIEGILMHWPFYGYRRVTRQLQREDWNIGETRVRRLLREIDHSCRVGKVRIRTTNSQHNLPRYPNRIKGLDIMEANQIWVADITYIRLGRRFIYLAIILDACTRGLRGWNLGRSLEKSLTMEALKMALARHPAPQIHHSDRAPVSPYIFSGGDTLFPAEEGTAQRLTQRSKDQWGQSVTWQKGRRGFHRTVEFP
jgi:putative transposase